MIAAFVSDTHCGSTVGLCPPEVNLPDGGVYKASRAQLWLLDAWRDFWRKVKERAGRREEIIVVFNGDEMDGRGKVPVQRITTNMAVQRRIFLKVVEIAFAECGRIDGVFFTAGSPYHGGMEVEDEEEVAGQVRAVLVGGRSVAPRLEVRFGPFLVWAQHHSWKATRHWTIGANASRMAAAVLVECAEHGWEVPDLFVCSHNHRVADSGLTYPKPRVIISPAWQLTTEYYRIRGGLMMAHIGGVIARFGRQTYEVEVIRYEAEKEPPLEWQEVRRGRKRWLAK